MIRLFLHLVDVFPSHVLRNGNHSGAGQLSGNLADAMLRAADAKVGRIVLLLGELGFRLEGFSVGWKGDIYCDE